MIPIVSSDRSAPKTNQATSAKGTGLRLQVSTNASGDIQVSAVKAHPRRQAKTFKFGSILIPYLEYTRGRYSYWMLFYYENGRRRQETRNTFAKAKKRAEEISRRIHNGELAMLHFPEEQRASYLRCLELIVPIQKPPEVVCALYADMSSRLPKGRTVEDIFNIGLQNLPQGTETKTIPQLLDLMLNHLEKNKAGRSWIDDLDSRLSKFTKKFTCPLQELRAPAINSWLGSLDVAPRTKNNYRIALSALVTYAKEKNFLDRSWSEMELVKREKEKPCQIKIYTPEQITSLLAHCRPNLVAFVALQAFAGIRTRELKGDGDHPSLNWRDIDIDNRLIYIPGPVAKAGTPDRIIPIQDNLANWLTRYAQPNGEICDLANISNAMGHTAKRAKVPFIRNALRKSFISYRLALVKDIGKVADEAGNSPQVIKTNYRRPIPPKEAKRWFEIYPTTSAILQLNFPGL